MTNRKGLILLLLLILSAFVLTAYKYYIYMNENPDYCSLCHLMEEGYRTHARSGHYQIICQHCHTLSTVEGNKMLMAFFIRGESVEQTHGRINPWAGCDDCHMAEAAQGSVTLRNSFGHARHVFMNKISCGECHSGAGHSYEVGHESCQGCHKDKLVHGMGMTGMYCLNCHDFTSESHHTVSSDKCRGCHEAASSVENPMSGLQCFECHHPHESEVIGNDDCLSSCHGNESTVGMHGVHIARGGMRCMDCHKPHEWRIGNDQARGLCDRCHRLRSPASFIN